MQPFKKLTVWHEAHALALRVYATAESLRQARHMEISSQLAANIAEGTGRTTSVQFAHFLQIATGSARELDYHLLLARDLGLLGAVDYAALEARTDEVTRMLIALRRTSLERGHPSRRAPRCRPPAADLGD